jgi:hypothetical protein
MKLPQQVRSQVQLGNEGKSIHLPDNLWMHFNSLLFHNTPPVIIFLERSCGSAAGINISEYRLIFRWNLIISSILNYQNVISKGSSRNAGYLANALSDRRSQGKRGCIVGKSKPFLDVGIVCGNQPMYYRKPLICKSIASKIIISIYNKAKIFCLNYAVGVKGSLATCGLARYWLSS